MASPTNAASSSRMEGGGSTGATVMATSANPTRETDRAEPPASSASSSGWGVSARGRGIAECARGRRTRRPRRAHLDPSAPSRKRPPGMGVFFPLAGPGACELRRAPRDPSRRAFHPARARKHGRRHDPRRSPRRGGRDPRARAHDSPRQGHLRVEQSQLHGPSHPQPRRRDPRRRERDPRGGQGAIRRGGGHPRGDGSISMVRRDHRKVRAIHRASSGGARRAVSSGISQSPPVARRPVSRHVLDPRPPRACPDVPRMSRPSTTNPSSSTPTHAGDT